MELEKPQETMEKLMGVAVAISKDFERFEQTTGKAECSLGIIRLAWMSGRMRGAVHERTPAEDARTPEGLARWPLIS